MGGLQDARARAVVKTTRVINHHLSFFIFFFSRFYFYSNFIVSPRKAFVKVLTFFVILPLFRYKCVEEEWEKSKTNFLKKSYCKIRVNVL